MITQDKNLKQEPSPADVVLLSDLEREIARLEAERDQASSRSDQLFSQVNIDDTGFALHRALHAVSGLDERLLQLRNLVAKVRSRIY